MPTFFLLISALVVGYLVHNISLKWLSRFEGLRQKVRLTNLVKSERSKASQRTLLTLMENQFSFVLKLKWVEDYQRLLSSLIQRAQRTDLTPGSLLVCQALLSLGGALVFGLATQSPELGFLAAAGGAALPFLSIRDQALKRERELLGELPNALEILSLCSEAGLTLEQGMDQYLRHTRSGPLQDEFFMILEQTKSGSSRKNALEASSSRLRLTDFTLFSSSLIQGERFGTGIAKTLRQLSLTLRDKQTQRTEKAVQEMPVKMLLPLVLLIMPVTFLIIFGPILIQFFHP